MSVTASVVDKLQQRQHVRAAARFASFRSAYSRVVYRNGELKLCDFYVK